MAGAEESNGREIPRVARHRESREESGISWGNLRHQWGQHFSVGTRLAHFTERKYAGLDVTGVIPAIDIDLKSILYNAKTDPTDVRKWLNAGRGNLNLAS